MISSMDTDSDHGNDVLLLRDLGQTVIRRLGREFDVFFKKLLLYRSSPKSTQESAATVSSAREIVQSLL
jgi:hypothetical protein